MTVKWQHFVPRVYLKNWETQVESLKEPDKPFQGIYYFEKPELAIGDGKNKASILCESRLYNINYDLSFIMKSCPVIEKDYIKQVYKLLEAREVNAFYEGNRLKTRKDLAEHFFELDSWELKYKKYPFNLARKGAILKDIKGINSYVIEHTLDDVVEKKWQQNLETFIYEMESRVPLNGVDEIRQINEGTVFEMVKMIIFLICRNPEFDYLGILPWIKDYVLGCLPGAMDKVGQKARQDFIQNQMDALWLVEIYKGLFGVPSGYFHTLIEVAQSSFQLMLYKCWEGQGEFITSDKPAFEHVSRMEATNINSIICPLTPQYILLLMKGESNSLNKVNFRRANTKLIRKLNNIVLNHAQKGIVSSSKHLGYIL